MLKSHEFRNVLLFLIFGAVLILSGGNIFNKKASGRFTFGVESGDVTSNSVVIWTQVDRDAILDLEVSQSLTFDHIDFKKSVHATSTSDFTAKTTLTGLTPGTEYNYRWRDGSTLSEVGRFKTAPVETLPSDVRFAWSGDTDSSKDAVGNLIFGPWNALKTAFSENIDFFIYLGDVIYSDMRGWDGQTNRAPTAFTLADFRAIYKEQKDSMSNPNLNLIPIYALWDDHEVLSDWAGQTIDKTRYEIGKEAFKEYMPISDTWTPSDSYCAGPTQFRVEHWGANVDLMILDTRSCRSDSDMVKTLCHNDMAPTLPSSIRDTVKLGPKKLLPSTVPPKCLDAIKDPTRTMLGKTQKEMFKSALLASKAKFKFVISSVNMQNTYAEPYDNWEGYAAERSEILKFIRDNSIKNVIFLSTDSHMNLINEVVLDPFSDRKKIADEVVTGPIAALTNEQNIIGSFPSKIVGNALLSAEKQILGKVGADCFNLNINSYGSVHFTKATGQVKIILNDGTGKVVKDEVTPSITCTKTFGP